MPPTVAEHPPLPKIEKSLAFGRLTIKAAEEQGDKRILRGIATTPQPDRMDDIVESEGAVYTLPIPLLSQHSHSQPIGHVTEVTVTKDGIEVVAEIVKDSGLLYVENAWKQIKAKLVQGFSIGFRPIEYSYIKDSYGIRFTKWDWLELSVVTVPANAGSTIQSIKAYCKGFANPATNDPAAVRPQPAAAPAANPQTIKVLKMTLAERIAAAQARVKAARTALEAINKRVEDGDTITDEDATAVEAASAEIESAEKEVSTLEKLERAAGQRAAAKAGVTQAPSVVLTRTREKKPAEMFFRMAAAHVLAHHHKKAISDVLASFYASDRELPEFIKAAQNPADTTTVGWAAELVATSVGEFLDLLNPASIWPRLRGYGVPITVTNPIRIPARDGSKRVAGAFVGEGAPIPVKGGKLVSSTLSNHKLAVITDFTKELGEASSPQIEGLLRKWMVEDTGIALDTALIDNTAASATRPAGLQVGALTHASTGSDPDQIAADLKLMIADLAGAGGLRTPVWMMNPMNLVALQFLTTALGTIPEWLNGIGQKMLVGYPVIDSVTIPVDQVWLIDAADFLAGNGVSPAFEVSDVATLHEEDTTPLPIVDGAGVSAKPVRSMFQTDSVAIKLRLPVTWAMGRTGMVSVLTGVAW